MESQAQGARFEASLVERESLALFAAQKILATEVCRSKILARTFENPYVRCSPLCG